MRFRVALVLLLLAGSVLPPIALAIDTGFEAVAPAAAGYNQARLEELQAFCVTSGSAALIILQDGKQVFAWGEVAQELPVHSIRKSLLGALIGIHIARGDIDSTVTLAALDIDDIEPVLSEEERQARLVDLMAARSGVYHPAAAEAAAMIAGRPARGSHPPGEHFYYNNWDFNALGTAFRNITGRDIFVAFYEDIAVPIGMRDFAPTDGCYFYEEEKSRHPAYHFWLSARDLARFGQLCLQGGHWDDAEIIPAEWLREATRYRSHYFPEWGVGYGLLWNVFSTGVGLGHAYFHTGAGVHVLAVYPDLGMVFVHRADTEGACAFSREDLVRLFDLVLRARIG